MCPTRERPCAITSFHSLLAIIKNQTNKKATRENIEWLLNGFIEAKGNLCLMHIFFLLIFFF